MFGTVFRYEIRYHLSRPITWLYVALFTAGSFFVAGTDTIQLAGASGQVMRNAPWVIVRAMHVVVTLGQIIVAGLVGSAVLRDYQHQTHELLFTTRITRFAYLGGRFAGGFVVMVLVHLGIPLGLALGTLMPGLDPATLLPLDPAAYLVPFVTLVVPTVLVLSAVFFAVGALTRSAFAVHAQGIVLLVAWLIAQTLIGQLGSTTLAALLDPIGSSTYAIVTRYWTVVEKNALIAPSGGLLLANRLLWTAVALGLAGLTYALFRFRADPPAIGRRRKPIVDEALPEAPASALVAVTRRFDRRTWWRQTLSTARLAFWSIVRQVPFAVIVTIGLINLGIAAGYAETIFGQKVWPVTYTVVEVLDGNFFIFFVVLIALYAGDTVWRERELRAAPIVDALPAPTSARLLGGLAGVILVQIALLVMLALAGIAFQAGSGYYRFEPSLYAAYLFGTVLPSLVQLTALAVLVHVLVNHKYLAHALVILAFVFRFAAPRVGLEHPLFQFAKAAPFRYSDMNGFGPYVPGLVWMALYWTGVAGLLGVAAYLFWVRGTEVPWAARLREARRRWQGAVRPVAGAFALVALGVGGVIFYNANVVNGYRPAAATRKLAAEYERMYEPQARLPTPKLVDVVVRADLEPERLAFALSGTFRYVNEQRVPIDTILITTPAPRELRIDTLSWSRPATVMIDDSVHRVRVYCLDTPLAPGDTLSLRYRASYRARGFPIGSPDTAAGEIGIRNAISANGSFIGFQYFPFAGYLSWRELASDAERRKERLAPRVRAAPIDDDAARAVTYMGLNADWVSFRATVSTAPDQIGIAPGRLVREYEENGRRVFEYENNPMLAFFSFLSARYEVKRDRWGDVALEIYHHPGHEFNVDRMMAAMKASLAEFSNRFGPYQFEQLRVLEFPRYNQFAQAFPNTVPFSENIGFILRAGAGNDDIDTPYYVTSHEVAHQWWFHQVIGGNVQGATMLSESLANYSAILAMEQTYGRNNVRKFLLQQLDAYLVGRGGEARAELPLMLVENQTYIHYNKGSLALYALRDLIGDDAMNRALSRFVRDKAYQEPPFTTSRELLEYLEAETPDSVRYALVDLFRTITLWDHAVEAATATRRADGRFDVAVQVRAAKARADSLGAERNVPIADLIDIGVFGEPAEGYSLGKPLHLEKHWITASDTTLHVVVDALPRKAGIDPYNKLIDRNPRDNVADIRMR